MALYRHVPPLRMDHSSGRDRFPIADSVTDKEEVELVVRRIYMNQSGGTSGIWVEHLRAWIQAATRKDTSEPTKWGKVVSLVQVDFKYGNLAEE